jgi:virginiamycin B lyase
MLAFTFYSVTARNFLFICPERLDMSLHKFRLLLPVGFLMLLSIAIAACSAGTSYPTPPGVPQEGSQAVAFASAHATPAPSVTEFPIPLLPGTGEDFPIDIVTGPDQALWFTDQGNTLAGDDGNAVGSIGRITTSGAITQYPLPNQAAPYGITVGPDGALWYADITGDIGRITTSGNLTIYSTGQGSGNRDITVGADGALWFTENVNNRIGRITTSGALTEFPLTTGGSPFGIAAGSDGALWFTLNDPNAHDKIGRITTAGTIRLYHVPSLGESEPNIPEEIVAGPDGALWFTEELTNTIGRITTKGVVTQYNIPTGGSAPRNITAGPDGALWFTDDQNYFSSIPNGTNIGRITTSGNISIYKLPPAPNPSQTSYPTGITTGPDKNLWFGDGGTESIGRLIP